MDVVYFIVLVGVLIFVHELGHFVWAKFFGVRVLRFSLGFGPRIAGFSRGGTEYVLAAIPLGGYVRMLGEGAQDVVAEADAAHSFGALPIWKRFVIVVAGPLMNLLFPIVLYFVVALGDQSLPPAVIGIVFPDRPADGKLLPGDRVISIEGDEIVTFDDLVGAVEDRAGEPLDFVVERAGAQVRTTITPALVTRVKEPLELAESTGLIGVMPMHPEAVIGVADPASPAGAARLQTFDVVVAARGRPIRRFIDLGLALDRNRGELIPLTYLRPTRLEGALGGLVDLDLYEPHVATVTPEPGEAAGLTRAGLESAELYVSEVQAGSPESRLGLRPGDRLVSLDGRAIRVWATFLEDLRVGQGRTHTLVWRRAGRELTARYTLTHEHGTTEYGQRYDRYAVSMRNWVPVRSDALVPNPHRFLYAVRAAFTNTAEVVKLTVFSVVRLLQGRLTARSLGGPLQIFSYAGEAARAGTLDYLKLMAFISVNLGLINLLPIPLLDGGHLLFFTFETVMRKPVPRRVREYASIAGLSVLILLMIFAFANDLQRKWPSIVETVNHDAP
jgi:regulator of sigma E protease